MPESVPSIWRDRAFVLFWSARSISTVGSLITQVVLPILVFQLTASALQTSLLTTLGVLPYLIFGLFAGAFADRANRRAIMVGCDLTNMVLLASIPIAAYFGHLTIAHIYIVHFLSATAFVWFDAANLGAMTTIVGRKRVIEATSAIWSASTMGEIIAPSIAGLLVALVGAPSTIYIDSISYLLSAVALMLVPRSFNSAVTSEAVDVAGGVMRTLRADIQDGIRFIWHHRLVRTLTLIGFGASFSSGAITGLIVVYGVRAQKLTSTDARLGWLFTAGAIGAFAASLLLPLLSKSMPIARITLIGLSANILILIALVLAPGLWYAMIFYLLWEAFYTLIVLNGFTLRQLVTPANLLSRVNVSARMVAWGGAPFGAAVGGLLAEHVDIRVTYLLAGIGVVLSTLYAYFSPLRTSTASTSNVVKPGQGSPEEPEKDIKESPMV